MARFQIRHATIAGICCALPGDSVHIRDIPSSFSEKELKKFTQMTGVERVFRADRSVTTADLCLHAAERLLKDLGWEKDSIDGLIFLSQGPDYALPATACVLQHKLGLPKTSFAFDVNLGCSGYVYGLWMASKFLDGISCRRVLFLNGDVSSHGVSPYDTGVYLLFGDAGAATAIEFAESASAASYVLGTDGSGYQHLIVPGGGARNRRDETTGVRKRDADGVLRAADELYMNGVEVFNFTMTEVPPLIEAILGYHSWSHEDVDCFAFHQANKFLLQQVARKSGIDPAKFPINLDKYGNTSSASIPLVLNDVLKSRKSGERLNVVMAGFGVGFSWGAAALNMENTFCSELVYVKETQHV